MPYFSCAKLQKFFHKGNKRHGNIHKMPYMFIFVKKWQFLWRLDKKDVLLWQIWMQRSI